MTLTNVPNDVFAFNPSTISLPPAVNRGICLRVPDTVRLPAMYWNTPACNLNTASLRVTLTGPLAKSKHEWAIRVACRGKGMSSGQLRGFWSSCHLSVMVAKRQHQDHSPPSRE